MWGLPLPDESGCIRATQDFGQIYEVCTQRMQKAENADHVILQECFKVSICIIVCCPYE